MGRESDRVDVHELLSRTEWLRRLARRLAVDESVADEAVQRTFLKAMQQPPERRVPATGWLARVLRNFLASHARSEQRRRGREAGVVPPAAPPTPQEILDHETARQRVVQAVLDLGEPYRDMVLLRYWSDLEPAEIAARLGVPASTVRNRLRRAREQLRARLDRDCGGRDAWVLVLSLLEEGAKPATLSASVLAGGAAMASAKFLWIGGAVVVAAAAWVLVRDSSVPEPEPPGVARAALATVPGSEPVEVAQEPAAEAILAGAEAAAASGASDETPVLPAAVRNPDVSPSALRPGISGSVAFPSREPEGSSADRISIRASGHDGKTLADLRFHFRHGADRPYSSGGLQAILQPEGDYWLIPIREVKDVFAPWRPDEYFLLDVKSESHGMQHVELVEGQWDVSLRFAAPAFIELSIPGSGSGPCENPLEAGVLEQEEWKGPSPYDQETGLMRKDTRPVSAEGTTRLGPFAPGEYHLVLAVGPEEEGLFRREVASMEVHLRSGDNAISIPMPLLTDLTVRFPEGSRGQTLSLRKAGEEWVRFPGMPERVDLDRALDAEGRATFPCVPPGEYVLEDREGSMTLRVPAAGEVLFEPRPYDAVRVVLESLTGTLAEWGLRDGDLVIAIDGIPLDTRRKRDDVFTYISFKESVVLTLDRGGTVLQVPVEWPESPPNLGGRLEPASR